MPKKRKRKKAAKKRRDEQSSKGGPNMAQVLGQIREALSEGRARRAWGLALPLLHQSDLDADARELVTATVAARAEEMVGDGHGPEAWELVDKACRGSWLTIEALDTETRLLLECGGGKPDLLHGYEGDNEIREAANEVVTRTGALLVQLYDHPYLAEDHPLREQARIIYDAWNEIEDGPAGAAYDRLRRIPRRSPFSDWRLFVQALKAYYERNDSTVQANLQRISDGSAAAFLGEALDDLMAESTRSDRWFKKLREAATREGTVKADLKELDGLYEDASVAKICREAVRIAQMLQRQDRISLATDVYTCTISTLGRDLDDREKFLQAGSTFQPVRNVAERAFGRVGHYNHDEHAEDWREVLAEVGDEFSSLGRALILNRIAYLERESPLERAVRRRFGDDEDDFDNWDLDAPSPSNPVEETYAESIETHPLPQTFESWCTWRQENEYATYDVLAQWLESFPDDTSALYSIIKEARRIGEFAMAREAFEKLRATEGNSPRLQSLEQFLLLDEAGVAFDNGDSDRGEEILAKLDPEKPIAQIAAQCVRYSHAGKDDRSLKIAAGKALGALERPYLVWHFFRYLGIRRTKASLPASVKRQFKDPELVMRSYLDLVAIDDPEWRFNGKLWSADLKDAATGDAPSELLLQCLAAMRRVDPDLRGSVVQDFVAFCVAGADRDDEHLGDFIAYRALAYHALDLGRGFYGRPLGPMYTDCLIAAWALAERRGSSRELVRQIAMATGCTDLQDEVEERTDEDIDAIIVAVKKARHAYSTWSFEWHYMDMDMDMDPDLDGSPQEIEDTIHGLIEEEYLDEEELQELIQRMDDLQEELDALEYKPGEPEDSSPESKAPERKQTKGPAATSHQDGPVQPNLPGLDQE